MFKRLGLYLQYDLPLPEALRLVQYAELRGFESVWQAERVLSRDSFVALAAFAAATTRIKLGCGVVDPWTRNAALLATTLLTLDDLAPDRIICGLGPWTEREATRVGVERQRPLLALREVTMALRALLAGKPYSKRGETVNLNAAALDMLPDRREPRHIPIIFAATAPKTLALAGEIADGALLNYLVTPGLSAAAVDELRRGAHTAARPLEFVDRPQLIACAVHRDRAVAFDAARRFVAGACVTQPALMHANGVSAPLLDEIARIDREAGFESAYVRVPDEILISVTACGTPDDVRRKVSDYLDAGATSPVLVPLCEDVRFMIDVFTDPFLV
jgi:5,10-methylenetetrahydromethanopterin reductase